MPLEYFPPKATPRIPPKDHPRNLPRDRPRETGELQKCEKLSQQRTKRRPSGHRPFPAKLSQQSICQKLRQLWDFSPRNRHRENGNRRRKTSIFYAKNRVGENRIRCEKKWPIASLGRYFSTTKPKKVPPKKCQGACPPSEGEWFFGACFLKGTFCTNRLTRGRLLGALFSAKVGRGSSGRLSPKRGRVDFWGLFVKGNFLQQSPYQGAIFGCTFFCKSWEGKLGAPAPQARANGFSLCNFRLGFCDQSPRLGGDFGEGLLSIATEQKSTEARGKGIFLGYFRNIRRKKYFLGNLIPGKLIQFSLI